MAGHTSICGTPQVSKYCSCIYFKKKQKTNRKNKKSSVRGCSGIGTRKTKKMIFFSRIELG
jgi:hypothetical protein